LPPPPPPPPPLLLLLLLLPLPVLLDTLKLTVFEIPPESSAGKFSSVTASG